MKFVLKFSAFSRPLFVPKTFESKRYLTNNEVTYAIEEWFADPDEEFFNGIRVTFGTFMCASLSGDYVE